MEISGRNVCGGRAENQKEKATLVGGFNGGFPHALTMLGFPAVCLANFSEVLGNSSAALLGLGISNLVKVHHFYLPLSFLCALIITQKRLVVKPLFSNFLNIFQPLRVQL